MKAVWQGSVIAEAPQDELIFIEGNWYFPPESVNKSLLEDSDTPYNCPWKGDCSYFNICKDEKCSVDSAWTYKQPLESAVQKVKQDFSNYVAFWRDVSLED